MYPPIDTRYDQGVSVPVPRNDRAFSLIELLVVMGIIGILASLMMPAFNALNGAGNLTKSASDISGILEQARTYAMGKNTYVYVGIQEIDEIQAQAGTMTPGIGRVVLATVASEDGTRPYTSLPTNLLSSPTNDIMVIGKVHYFDNLHLTNAGSLTSGTNMTGRPGASAYTGSTNNFVDLSQVGTNGLSLLWTNGALNYSFAPVIEFDPQGVARVQTNATHDSAIQEYIELPLIPTHGNVAVTNTANQAAVQINGLTGAVRVYRP